MKYKLTANNEDRVKIIKDYYIKIAVTNFIYAFIFSFTILSPLLFFKLFLPYLFSSLGLTLSSAILLTLPALRIIKSSNETIEIFEDCFKYSFVDLNKPFRIKPNGEIYEREEIEMKFSHIEKIEINHFFNFLTVYGQMDYRTYADYEDKKLKMTLKMDGEKNKWTIVPIFDEIEQFSRYLLNNSGSQMVHVNFPLPQFFKKQKRK